MRREVVIGASGLIGGYVLRDALMGGAQAMGTYCAHQRPGLKRLDIGDQGGLGQFLEDEQPSVVYLAAALPNVDWVEDHPEESARVNVTGALALISRLRGSKATLVYYSSDYVFDGRTGPYVEEDEPDPVNEYGRQKLAVERAIQRQLDNWLILRVTVVYGWEPLRKNFVQRSVSELRSGGRVQAPVDQFGNPTYAPDLARASRELVRKPARGLFHLVGEARTCRYELALEMAQVFELPCDLIRPVRTSSLKQRARRPLEGGMVVDKARAVLGRPLMSYSDGLRRMRDEEGILNECR